MGVDDVLSVASKEKELGGKVSQRMLAGSPNFPTFVSSLLVYFFLILDSNMTHVFQDTQSTSNLMILESQVYLYNLSSRNNDLSLRLTTSHKDVRN